LDGAPEAREAEVLIFRFATFSASNWALISECGTDTSRLIKVVNSSALSISFLAEGMGNARVALIEWSVMPMCVQSQMYPAKHMLISSRGSRWKETILAMLTVYIDDSGTDPSQPSAIASALIIPATRLDDLERVWKVFKADNLISEFHSSECAAGQDGTEFSRWSSQRKHHVFYQVREITKEFALGAFSFAVTKSDYDEFVNGELRDFCGRYHYTWAVSSIIRNLNQWAQNQNINVPFEYIFDWMGAPKRNKARAEIEEWSARSFVPVSLLV
jgi:hypothetical protein